MNVQYLISNVWLREFWKNHPIVPCSETVWVSAAKTGSQQQGVFTAKPNICEMIILTAYCWSDCCAGMKLDHKLGQWLFGWHNTSRIWDLGFFPGNTLNPRINFSFRKNFSSRDFCTKYFEVDVSGIISTTRPALILPLSVPDSCCTVGYSRLIRLFLPHKFIIF